MSGMVEKVARSICLSRLKAEGRPGIAAHGGPMCWDEQVDIAWRLYEGDARAAIAAMRVPTEQVEDAARGLWLWYGGAERGRQVGWTIRRHNEAAGYGLSLEPDEADLDHLPKHVCGRIAWRTMIDAALREDVGA